MNKYQNKIHKETKKAIEQEIKNYDNEYGSIPSALMFEYCMLRSNKHYRQVKRFVRKSLIQWINETNYNWLNKEFKKYNNEIKKLNEHSLMKRGLL
jgi:hypothetical protein